jgi:pyruvate,water dikinase
MTTFTGAVEQAIGNLLVTLMGRSAPKPDEALLEEDGIVVQFRPPEVHPSPGMLFKPWITLWRTRHYHPTRWEDDPLLGDYITKARALDQHDFPSLPWKQNIEIMHEALALIPRAMELRERYLPPALLGLAGLWLLLGLAQHRNCFGALVSGVKTKTTETNQALEDLAAQVRSHSVLLDLFQRTDAHELEAELKTSQEGQAFLKRFETFLDQYGHRETGLTISQPAWKDQPDNVLAILKILSGAPPKQPKSYEAWQRTRDELLADSILGTRLLRKPFLNSLDNARALFQIREDTHFYATLVQPTIRNIALELGRRLVQVGALGEAGDVFHLRLDELETLGVPWPPSGQTIARTRELVARRKAKRASLANKPMADPSLLAAAAQSQAEENVLLSGTSGSPGMARGPARIVHELSEFGKLRAGDVLIAPVTNPAWTPLFQRAVAVVVDSGGAASHAAIVAREYAVPAVMGTVDGTRRLADGQRVRVDGGRGAVTAVARPTRATETTDRLGAAWVAGH